jgi:putative transposase
MEALTPNTSYHIYNHANGFENIFNEKENYRFFLEKYCLYITPIAETYAYSLLPNHFHLVVRIRKLAVIENYIRINNVSGVENISSDKIAYFLSKQFSNLFSSYTQLFNKMYDRMGSLFMKNFKRDPILDKEHFINAVIYTHRNPIHHGFRSDFDEWEYCSYQQIIDNKNEIVETFKLLKMIDKELFIALHEKSKHLFLNKFSIQDID